MSVASQKQGPLKEMMRLRYFRWVTGLALFLWVAISALPSIRVLPIIYGKTAVPLHYNVHVGVDNVGPWWQIYVVPVIALAIIVVNLLLARYMWTRDEMLAYVAVTASLILQCVLLTAMIFIVYLSLQYA